MGRRSAVYNLQCHRQEPILDSTVNEQETVGQKPVGARRMVYRLKQLVMGYAPCTAKVLTNAQRLDSRLFWNRIVRKLISFRWIFNQVVQRRLRHIHR